MANDSSTSLGYRWVMFVLGALAAVSQTIVWLSPAPLLTTIVQDLKINFGNAGWAPAFMTVPMELEGATAEMVGGAVAIIFGVGFIVSYFVPIAFGAMIPIWGIYKTMLVFSFSMILSIVTLFIIPETGPRSKLTLGIIHSHDQ